MANTWATRLYVKQAEIELPFRLPSPIPFWACGPASLLTCLKLLGNREITPARLFKAVDVSFWQQFGELLQGGGGTDEKDLRRGAKKLGYKAQIQEFLPGAKARHGRI